MQDTSEEEGIPIQIQFEFLNANEEMELSQVYTVKIQPTDDFETNRITMINSCDFRTQEERIYYYMFDKNLDSETYKLLNNLSIDIDPESFQ